METLHIVVLALIQGLTEFLPISSSAHLLLPQGILGWPDQGLAFDVSVHVGTLSAVLLYFRKDVTVLIAAWSNSTFKGQHNGDSRLAWLLVLATVPAALAGLLFDDFIEANLRSTLVIAVTTIVFGLLLWWADRPRGNQFDNIAQLTISAVFIIGCAQALALIPGTSRSGITITAALLCGLPRLQAARFSFLMAIPIILLSGGYKILQLVISQAEAPWLDLTLGIVLAAISAYLCIHYFLNFINRIGMLPFVIYRLVLGIFLLLFVAMGFQ